MRPTTGGCRCRRRGVSQKISIIFSLPDNHQSTEFFVKDPQAGAICRTALTPDPVRGVPSYPADDEAVVALANANTWRGKNWQQALGQAKEELAGRRVWS